jgi:putative methyltransferase (TIGR04325 family)
MVARAARLGGNYFRAFTSNEDAVAALGSVDFVHASGALQCVADPLGTLKRLASLRARHIMLARLPIWRERTLVGLQRSMLSQNGLGPMTPHVLDREVCYPVTFVHIDEIVHMLESSGYKLILSLASPSGAYTVQDKSVAGMTLIWRAQ